MSPLAMVPLISADPAGQRLLPLQATDMFVLAPPHLPPWFGSKVHLTGRRLELFPALCGEAGPATTCQHKPQGPRKGLCLPLILSLCSHGAERAQLFTVGVSSPPSEHLLSPQVGSEHCG